MSIIRYDYSKQKLYQGRVSGEYLKLLNIVLGIDSSHQPSILELQHLYCYDFSIEHNNSTKFGSSEEIIDSFNPTQTLESIEGTIEFDENDQIILIDDHLSYPKIIRHIPEIGFYIIQPYYIQENGTDEHLKLRQDFVAFTYGSDLRCIRFAPIASSLLPNYIPQIPTLFAFLYGNNTSTDCPIFGICHVSEPEDVIYPFGLNPPNGMEILGIFWIAPRWVSYENNNCYKKDYLFTVICRDGLRLFMLEKEMNPILLQTISDVSRILNVWWEDTSHYVLLEIRSGILQPYYFNIEAVRFVKLPIIDLKLPKWRRLAPSEVSLMMLYDMTYCLYSDPANGNIHVKSLDLNKEYELTIDLKSPGELQLQRIDNILVIHRPDRAESHLFDIRSVWIDQHINDLTVPSQEDHLTFTVRITDFDAILNDSESNNLMKHHDTFDSLQYPDTWDFRSLNGLVIDRHRCIVYCLKLNLPMIVSQLVSKKRRTITCAAEFLLERRYGKYTLLKLLLWDFQTFRGSHLFDVLTRAYRRAIDLTAGVRNLLKMRQSNQTIEGPCSQLSLNVTLEAQIHTGVFNNDKIMWVKALLTDIEHYQGSLFPTLLTELDITVHVFFLCIKEKLNIPEGLSLFDIALQINTPFKECIHKTSTRYFLEHILQGALDFSYCLFKHLIRPHRIFLAFLFDLCVFSENYTLLEELFQFRIIPDCQEILLRLRRLWTVYKSHWILHIALDLARRLKNWHVVAELLLEDKQYFAAASILRQHHLFQFPIETLLTAVSEDISAQQQDPELLSEMLSALKQWILSTALPLQSHLRMMNLIDTLSYKDIQCNITNCQKWFPDLPYKPNETCKESSIIVSE